MTLARLLLHAGRWSSYVLRDAWAACLPNEQSFELPRLGPGVLTYIMTRPDPLSVVQGWKASDISPLRRIFAICSDSTERRPTI